MSEMNALKNNVVTQMFVDTADQNYLIARWAYHRRLFLDFFWNACQALEKYLKASLLLNGKSAKDQGHDLTKLFEGVEEYAAEFFPPKLTQPAELSQLPNWHDETPKAFIGRFNDLGDSNNRYSVFGYIQRREDLQHFDQMVYAVRRVAFNLDASPFIGPPSDTSPKTVREVLKHIRGYSPRSGNSRLDKILTSKGDDELRDAGLKYNFPFAPADYDHTKGSFRIGTSSANSALYQCIVSQAERPESSPGDQEAAELGEWVIDNIQLSKSIQGELCSYIQTLLKRTP